MFQLKRVYEQPSRNDGLRVLVDRIWPRKLSKERAAVGLWLKELAPSTELRKWFGHDPKNWKEFQSRYRKELRKKKDALTTLKRSVLIDGRGVPLAAAVDGANVHDQTLLAPTLDGIPVSRPEPAPYRRQHLCLDKGYVGEPMEQEVRKRNYIPHVPVKGGEQVTRHHPCSESRRPMFPRP